MEWFKTFFDKNMSSGEQVWGLTNRTKRKEGDVRGNGENLNPPFGFFFLPCVWPCVF